MAKDSSGMSAAWSKVAFFTAAVAALAVGAFFYQPGADASGGRGSAVAEAAPAALELAEIDLHEAAPARMSETLRVSGALKPIRQAIVKSKVSGTVVEVGARAGDRVRQGDVLVRFEEEDLRSAMTQQESALTSARAQLLLAEQGLAKAAELARKGFASQSTLEKAQSDAATAAASVQGLEAQLAVARQSVTNAEVLAPFDGTVSVRRVEPGETATSGAELMTVVDVSSLEAEVLVATRDVRRIAPGQEVVLAVEGGEGSVTGQVDRVSPVANDGSRSVPVFVRIANPDGGLWGGMFASGEIEVRSADGVIAVPSAAVREDGEGAYVLKVDGERAVRQAVDVISSWKAGTLVQLEGLDAGDMILAAPVKGLAPGASVALPARR